MSVLALAAFLVAVAASMYVLLPRREQFVFAMVGAGLYEGLYEVRDDLIGLQKLVRLFRLAAGALTAEIVVLIAMVSDTLL